MASDPNKKISVSKISGGILKANMKLWGGDKIPLLNGIVNFDKDKFLSQFQVEASVQQKLKSANKNIAQLTNELGAEEQKVMQLKMALITVINKVEDDKNVIMLTAPSAFTSSGAYKLNQQLALKLGMNNSIVVNQYYALRPNIAHRDIENSYKKAIDSAKKTEQQLITQMAKLNKVSSELKKNQKITSDIIKNYRP